MNKKKEKIIEELSEEFNLNEKGEDLLRKRLTSYRQSCREEWEKEINLLPAFIPGARATDYEDVYRLGITKTEGLIWEISYCGGGDSGCLKIIEDTNLLNGVRRMNKEISDL